MLEIAGVRKSFGAREVVCGATLDVPKGQVTSIIGPNGAGKTTLFNLISGTLSPDAGTITFEGRRIEGMALDDVFRLGLARTFQIARGLKALSVRENVLLAAPEQRGLNMFDVIFRPRLVRRAERANLERADEILERLNLYRLRDEPAANLSGGQQKLLELGRAIMAEPRLVLLDEPTAGVHPDLIRSIGDYIGSTARDLGVTYAVVEHNMRFVERISDRVVVLAEGRVLTSGSFEEVREDARVLEAYLGRGAMETGGPVGGSPSNDEER